VSFSISSSDVLRVARTSVVGARRFLLAAAFTVVAVLAPLWTLTSDFRAGFLAPEYGMWVEKLAWVQDCHFAPTVVLGDSRMVAGVVPRELGDATNLALGGASPIETYFTMQHAFACPNPPRRVIVSFSPSQLEATDYYWPRTALFGYLSFAELEQVRRESRRIGDKTLYGTQNIGDFDAILTNWLYAHHFPSYYMSSLVNGRIVGRLGAYRAIQQEVAETGGHHLYGQAHGTNDIAEEAHMTTFRAQPLLDDYFAKLLAMCQQSGAEVYYVAAPWSAVTYDRASPEALRQIGDYVHGLAQRFPNLHVIAPVNRMADKYFGDPYHLNAAGAERFTAQIAASLRESTAQR
jgi:hypothetical protein